MDGQGLGEVYGEITKKEGRYHMDQDSIRQTTMESIDGRLQPAVDGQGVSEEK